jgi:hypothetical protein
MIATYTILSIPAFAQKALEKPLGAQRITKFRPQPLQGVAQQVRLSD